MLSTLALALASPPPPVVNGFDTENYPEVGLILVFNTRGNAFGLCTATAVHARALVTAAHCLDETEVDIGEVRVTFEREYAGTRRGDWFSAERWTVHPDFDRTALTDDLAVIHFADDLPAPVMQVATQAPSEADVGENFRLVGYGRTGDNDESSPEKRAADLPLSDFTENWLWLLDKRDGRGSCFGDSGGPVLRLYDDGSYAQASVTSWGTSCEDGGAASTRLDNALSFLADEGVDYTRYGSAPPSYPEVDEDLDPEDDDYVSDYGLGDDDDAACSTGARGGGWTAALVALLALARLRRLRPYGRPMQR